MRACTLLFLLCLPPTALATACASGQEPATTGTSTTGSGGATGTTASTTSAGTGGATTSSTGTGGAPPSLFAPAASYLVAQPGTSPMWLTTSDVDGDGKADLVTANQALGIMSDVSVLLGKGDGTFLPQIDTPLGMNQAFAAVTGDFDGDGKADLAAMAMVLMGGGPGVLVLKGTGGGHFQPSDQATFYPSPGQPGVHPITVDLDGDGHLDLVVPGNGVRILLGSQSGAFTDKGQFPAGAWAISVVAADLNHDGKLDLAVAASKDVAVLLGNGDGTFQPQIMVTAGDDTRDIVTGDFDGDGKLDLAVADGTGNDVVVLLGNGDGTFKAPIRVISGKTPIAIAAADFDGDGKLDLAAANYQANTVSVLLGKGDGTFQAAQQIDVGNTPNGLVTADFNGDGKPDLATADYQDRDVSVLLNTRP
jgi:hypothetical protein